MDRDVLLGAYVVVLAAAIGALVVGRAPAPLRLSVLAGTTAIRGLVLVGALLILGRADSWWLQLAGFLATVAASASVAAGLVVAERAREDLGSGGADLSRRATGALGAGAARPPADPATRDRSGAGGRVGRRVRAGWRR